MANPNASRNANQKANQRAKTPADSQPVARVAVDISLAHLDRPFDYLVPAQLGDAARPGCRVRIRFAGQLVDGYLLDRAGASEHEGRLSFLDRVISPEPVLTPEIRDLARAVADRYAGTFADVLRLAIPPRHATTEKQTSPQQTPQQHTPHKAPAPGTWQRYPAGEAFLAGLANSKPVRAAWTALPGPHWPDEIAIAAATTAAQGRGTVIVVPDAKDLARVDHALTAHAAGHVTLSADLGRAERYRRWLQALRGGTRIVAGTRAAMFAPIPDLGLVVLWDDGDDLHADPHAPYPHAREVLALRAHRAGAAALIGGFTRTAELTQLVASNWAKPLTPSPQAIRQTVPRATAAWGSAADDIEMARDSAAMTARLPSLALRTARDAIRGGGSGGPGPVLVQVPRRGYLAAFACGRCRAQARCATCQGPLRIDGERELPDCRWCGALATNWSCPHCGGSTVRALVTGAARTAEELGRAFPGVPVRTSGGQQVLATVPDEPALIIATPGAEPVAAAGYAAELLLDGWALLGRPSLRAAEETLRRWLNAAALTRPGAPVVLLAEAGLPVVQAVIRWDPVTFAERDLAERTELRFPPAVRMAAITAPAAALADFLLTVTLPPAAEVLGPVPAPAPDAPEDTERALIRIDRRHGLDLAQALQAGLAARSARKEGGGLRVQLDPAEIV